MPDGLVQLRIQNFVKKFDIGRGGVQPSGGGGGGISSIMRGVKRKSGSECQGPARLSN